VTISNNEKYYIAIRDDATRPQADRDKAAAKADKFKRERKNRKRRGPYVKKTDPCPDHHPTCDGSSWPYQPCASHCPVKAWQDRQSEAQTAPVAAPVEAPKPVAKPAPAPKPAPVVEENPIAAIDRIIAESAKVVRDVPQLHPVATRPVVQVRKFPMLPGATAQESESCWLLDGWGHRMTIAEREKHVTNRDAYDARMAAKREAEKAALIASLPVRDVKAEERARQEQRAAEQRIQIRAEQPPAFREPNRGNPMSAVELQKLTQPTMQNSDGGISVEPDKRQWLPDLAVSLAQHLSTERRTELVKEPVLAVVVLST
jgi:hypothetical protein